MASTAVICDKGSRKSINQDACCLQVANTARGEVVMAVVCDGVGGLSHGERASAAVVRAFASWFRNDLPKLPSFKAHGVCWHDVTCAWASLLERTNAQLQTQAACDGYALGTTFTGVLATSGHYLVAQVGDSRLYLVGPGSCTQLTHDQTFVASLVERGEVSAQEAATHPCRSVILQAVGVSHDLCPVFTEGAYGPNELFVLCSDGAYRTHANDEIGSSFFAAMPWSNGSLGKACRSVVQRAIERGEQDNITVACFHPLANTEGR